MIEQRSEEWFAQRAAVSITASTVASVLGISSAFMSREQALRAKVREKLNAEREFKGNWATEWGEQHEDTAREAYEKQTGAIVFPAEFYVHPEHPYLGASPDGRINRTGLLEIKCPASKKIKTLDESPHYYAQVQLQLHCTSREWCDFVVWTPDDMHIERVKRDENWIHDNLGVLYAFHEEVESIVACPEKSAPYLEDLEVVRKDDTWANLETQYLECVEAIENLEAVKKSLRNKLVDEARDRKTRGKSILVFPSERSSISYSKALKDIAPDLDLSKYTSKPTISWSIKKIAGEN